MARSNGIFAVKLARNGGKSTRVFTVRHEAVQHIVEYVAAPTDTLDQIWQALGYGDVEFEKWSDGQDVPPKPIQLTDDMIIHARRKLGWAPLSKGSAITKRVANKTLYWTGSEWHPDKTRAELFVSDNAAWLALTDMVTEGYGTERV